MLGEHAIDEPTDEYGSSKIVELSAFPPAKANLDAVLAIKGADLIILGPGDLYTSILCNLVIEGIVDALTETKAKVVYVVNLMTKYGQTTGFSANDHIIKLEKYIGKATIDYCLVNKSTPISKKILSRYKEEKASPVLDDLKNTNSIKIIRRDLISKEIYKKHKADKLSRSLIRHDSNKLAKALMGLV